MPMRPPGRATRIISAIARSASHSSSTVTENTASKELSGNGTASALPGTNRSIPATPSSAAKASASRTQNGLTSIAVSGLAPPRRGASVRPAQHLVAVADGARAAREPGGGRRADLKSRAVFAGDHQHALGERRERRRIEPHRRTQHDPAEPFGMLPGKAGDIGRDLRCDMRLADPEMIEQRQKALGGGHVSAHATTPSARNAAISASL